MMLSSKLLINIFSLHSTPFVNLQNKNRKKLMWSLNHYLRNTYLAAPEVLDKKLILDECVSNCKRLTHSDDLSTKLDTCFSVFKIFVMSDQE